MYTLDDCVDTLCRELELSTGTHSDIVEGHIARALEKLPTDRFTEPFTVTLKPTSGYAGLPRNFISTTDLRPIFLGLRPLTRRLRLPGHEITFTYEGLPTDDEGLPLIPEAFQESLMLYIDAEYRFKSAWRHGTKSFNEYQAAASLYKTEFGRVRGAVNHLTDAEIEELRQVRNSIFLKPRR